MLELVSVDCAFLFKLRFSWFLVWPMIFFLLKSGQFGYYVMRLWISFKSSVLVGFCWLCASGGSGSILSLLPGGSKSPGSPLGLCGSLKGGGSSVLLRGILSPQWHSERVWLIAACGSLLGLLLNCPGRAGSWEATSLPPHGSRSLRFLLELCRWVCGGCSSFCGVWPE